MVSYDGTYCYVGNDYIKVMFLFDKEIGFYLTDHLCYDPNYEEDPTVHEWVKVAPKELTGW